MNLVHSFLCLLFNIYLAIKLYTLRMIIDLCTDMMNHCILYRFALFIWLVGCIAHRNYIFYMKMMGDLNRTVYHDAG